MIQKITQFDNYNFDGGNLSSDGGFIFFKSIYPKESSARLFEIVAFFLILAKNVFIPMTIYLLK